MATITATTVPDSGGVSLDLDFSAEGVTRVSVGRTDPTGFVALIRYGQTVTLTGGKATVVDYEAPLDAAVFYTATKVIPAPPPVLTATSATVTLASNGKAWLKDPARPSKNMVIPVLTSIPALTAPSRAGVFPILDRATPIVVTSVRQTPVGVAIVHTLTDAQRIMLGNLLLPGSILLLQAGYGFGSQYVHVGDVVQERIGLAPEPARRWTLPFTVVDRPEGLAEGVTTSKSWAAVKAVYATWGALKASGKTWEELLEVGP